MRALIFAASLIGETLSGPAVPFDGDTLLIDGPNGSTLHVRLYGVDAPEMGYPWRPQARAILDDAIVGQPVGS